MAKVIAILVGLMALVVGAASEGQPIDNATVDKLSEIGDVKVIADTDKLVAQAQQVLAEISKDSDAKRRASEFKTIRSLRLRLNKRSLELRALLESFRQYKLSLTSQLQQKNHAVQTSSSNRPQVEALTLEQDRLRLQINPLKASLESQKKQVSESSEEAVKREIALLVSKLELDIREKEVQLLFIEQRKAELATAGTTTQKEIDDLSGTVRKVDVVLSRAQTSLRDLDETLVEIDEQSNSLLQTDILSISYTDRSTYIFAVLVGAVIVGFFGVAFASDKVKEVIFSGESGIQFVTLFSLVIAIILFGVLKILEGKELAALLGGLSGYILGRGSRVQRDTPPPSNRIDPATGPTAGGT